MAVMIGEMTTNMTLPHLPSRNRQVYGNKGKLCQARREILLPSTRSMAICLHSQEQRAILEPARILSMKTMRSATSRVLPYVNHRHL